MDSDLKMNKLRNECSADRTRISALEAQVWEIDSDPHKNMPSKIDQKRRLPRLKLDMNRLKKKHESDCDLLEQMELERDINEAMRRAAAIGNELIVKRLLSREVNVNIPDESGYTAFMYACGNGHVEIANLMITEGDATINGEDSKSSPLILATNKGYADIIQLLISHGAVVDQRDSLDQTPLLIACEKDFVESVKSLLSAGANPNLTDKRYRHTSLHHAAMNGNVSIAQLLMEYGANNSLKNKNNMTALAIARSHQHYNVVDAITTI